MTNCAEILIQCLEAEGVKTVFGYPGGTVLHLYDALRRSSIHHVLTRTEQGAAHAASGYARLSGMPGVCIATSGPGATNLVTGLATAYMDSIPLVAFTGQVPTFMVGTDAFQEVDITGITRAITKHNYLVTNPEDISNIVREAFYLARTGRPGPVLIDLPKDIAAAACHAEVPGKIDLPGYKPTIRGNQGQIKHACNLLAGAQKPVIYAGGGIISSHAEDELLKLAECLQAPVAVTLMGKGAFPHTHRLSVGFLGMHGWPQANLAVTNCDVLLAVGVRFDDRVICNPQKFAPNAKIIHIDIDPAEISKNMAVKVPIVGDAKSIIKDMLKRLEQAEHQEWLERIEGWLPLKEKVYKKKPKILTGREIITALSELSSGKAVVTTDVGEHQVLAAQLYMTSRSRTFISSGGLGCMGYGLPAAIGAQMAKPKERVVCITGDGSFQMTLNELATAKEQKLPIKILLFNNNGLNLVRQLQRHYMDGKYFAVDFTANPDFSLLAAAYGVDYYRMEKPEDINPILKEVLASDKLTLVECIVNKEEMAYPLVLNSAGLDEMVVGKNQ